MVCLGAVLVLGQAGPARADDATEQARQHYVTGTKQYDMGHWDEAIAEFEKAYDLRPDPSFLYNLAQAHRRKGDLRRALDLYKNFALKLPRGSQRDEVEEKIAAVQRQIDEAAAKPAPVDERAISPTERSAPPEPAQAGEAPNPAAPMPTGEASPALVEPWPAFVPSRTPPAVQPETRAPVTTADQSRARRPGQGLRAAGIVCGAVGLAAVTTGVVFGLRARAFSDRVTGAKQFSSSDDSAGQSAATLQWVFHGVGAGALVIGGVLYYLGATAQTGSSAHLGLAPVLGPNTAGLSAAGVF